MSIEGVASVPDLKDKLLLWAKRRTLRCPDVNVTNLTSSFEDGKAFLYILHDASPSQVPYRPSSDSLLNRKKAFKVAEELYGVPQLLSYQDTRVFGYEQVVLMYFVELYNRLPKDMDK